MSAQLSQRGRKSGSAGGKGDLLVGIRGKDSKILALDVRVLFEVEIQELTIERYKRFPLLQDDRRSSVNPQCEELLLLLLLLMLMLMMLMMMMMNCCYQLLGARMQEMRYG